MERQQSHTSVTSRVDNRTPETHLTKKKNERKGQSEGSSASNEAANDGNNRQRPSTRKAPGHTTRKPNTALKPRPTPAPEQAATEKRDGHSGSSGHFRHWDHRALQRALKRGFLFRGKLRFNTSNRDQAYVTLCGLPTDVLIKVCRGSWGSEPSL